MSKDKKGRFSDLGFLGIDPTLGLGDKVLDHVEEAQDVEMERLQKGDYYAFCPGCHKKANKKELAPEWMLYLWLERDRGRCRVSQS
jgi:hypothetical protein